MSNTPQIIILIIALILLLILRHKYFLWTMKRGYRAIVKDLQSQGALAAETAVDLPYAQQRNLRIGLRDYRPKILTQMVANNIVLISGDNKFYLDESAMPQAKSSDLD